MVSALVDTLLAFAPDSSTGVHDEVTGPVKRRHRVEKEPETLPTILREELRF